MFRRGAMFYMQDSATGKQTSLRTKDEAEANSLLNARNAAQQQPTLNLHLARAYEYRVTSLRECPTPDAMQHCETPDKAADYWRMHIATHPHFNPDCECLAVLLLNTRKRVKGHQLVSIGTMDTILVHPREVFRLAIIAAASAVIVMHNHPSGESTPSEADIKVTRDLIRAGQLLKMELIDHVVIGNGNFSSLRALGYFYQ